MKILVVDDENDIVQSLKKGLELRGFQVDGFTDPEVALAAFRPGVYEIAILDIRMPKMNGFQLYRELLKRDDKIRVRFFTAFEEFREEFRKAFPDLDEHRFIRKPTTIKSLADQLVEDVRSANARKS